MSLVQTRRKRKTLKTETIKSADEEDEEDQIPEGFHLQEESPHCLNIQRAEDFQVYLRQLVLEFEKMLKAGGTDMRAEYRKVIESFFWACKANKTNHMQWSSTRGCSGKCERSFMQGMEIEVERERQCRPNDFSA